MYGRLVKVALPYSGIELEKFMLCSPDASYESLQKRLLEEIKQECDQTICEKCL